MIALDKITLRQGDFELSEVGFELDAGEYGVLMGRSGCGKTTLLEAVCGLRNIESGNIILGDRDVTALPPAERGVGYVPQDRALFPTLLVGEQFRGSKSGRSAGGEGEAQKVDNQLRERQAFHTYPQASGTQPWRTYHDEQTSSEAWL